MPADIPGLTVRFAANTRGLAKALGQFGESGKRAAKSLRRLNVALAKPAWRNTKPTHWRRRKR